MKIAVLSESEADEAAIHLLVRGLLGRPTEPISGPPLRTRGWPSVLGVLPSVLKHLHYQTDAEGFAVVVDSNHSTLHADLHEQVASGEPNCRLCQLRMVIAQTARTLRPLANRQQLRTAVGVATPAIEVWYGVGRGRGRNEVTLSRLPAEQLFSLKRELKIEVYGTDRPSLEHEKARATEEAKRLTQDLGELERSFPVGFGELVRAIRSW